MIAVTLGIAVVAGALMNVKMESVRNFLIFGSTDPYIAPGRQKYIQREFRNEM
jgi:hypothetical protein